MPVGRQSRHNLKYWMGGGVHRLRPLGPSYFGQQRYSFVRDLDAYVKGVLYNGKILDESTRINRREMGKEYLMLRMRTIWGVEENEYRGGFTSISVRWRSVSGSMSYGGRSAPRDDGTSHLRILLSNPLIGDALAIQAEAARDTMRPIIENGWRRRNRASAVGCWAASRKSRNNA